MKTISTSAFLAALVAVLILPLRFEVTGAMIAAAGVLALAAYDYTRQPVLRSGARRASPTGTCSRPLALRCEQHRLAA